MARTTKKELTVDFRPAIKVLGLEYVLKQVGIDRVIDRIGIDRVIEHGGKKELLKRISLDDILANLSPAERRELKRRLQ